MQFGCLYDARCGRDVIAVVRRTTHAWERLRGLLGQPPLDSGEGLLLDPCASIHTFAMRYPIDVVYLRRDLSVVRIAAHVPPWRVSFGWGADLTLELAAGNAARAGLRPGQALGWRLWPAP